MFLKPFAVVEFFGKDLYKYDERRTKEFTEYLDYEMTIVGYCFVPGKILVLVG